ncbi:MAG TPA: hypothetical protein VHO24_21055 [Opitutaceae bacterium]|nr:hypothetical protein [Opitutaceae bacterium]
MKILYFVAGAVVAWLAFTWFHKTAKETPAEQLSPATARETGPIGKQNTPTGSVRASPATPEPVRVTVPQVPTPAGEDAAKAAASRAEWAGKTEQLVAYTVSQALDQSCNEFFERNPVDAATRKKAINVLTDETLSGMDIGALYQREGGLTPESVSQLLAAGRAKTAEQLKEIMGVERATAFLAFIAAKEAQAEAGKAYSNR